MPSKKRNKNKPKNKNKSSTNVSWESAMSSLTPRVEKKVTSKTALDPIHDLASSDAKKELFNPRMFAEQKIEAVQSATKVVFLEAKREEIRPRSERLRDIIRRMEKTNEIEPIESDTEEDNVKSHPTNPG